jgi:molybdopterin-guanine dinucleotide biosynthesis protein A
MIDIPCIIFAGGKSSRMGEDKALLPFGKFDTLTQFQLSRLSEIFTTVYISCKDKSKFDSLKDNEDANFIEDIKSDNLYAPTTGFISIFENLHVDRFFVISVDSPFVSKYEIDKIIENDTIHVDATIAKTTSSIEPMCGVYHRTLHAKFIDMFNENNHKLGLLLKTSNTTYVEFGNESPFLNLNHPLDYQKALKML